VRKMIDFMLYNIIYCMIPTRAMVPVENM
jgi:hypothetical protein